MRSYLQPLFTNTLFVFAFGLLACAGGEVPDDGHLGNYTAKVLPIPALESGVAQALDVVIARDGTLLIVDRRDSRIRRFSATGRALGAFGSWGPGPGSIGRVDGIAASRDGEVCLYDVDGDDVVILTEDGRVVRRFSPRIEDRLILALDVARGPNAEVLLLSDAGVHAFSPRGQFLRTIEIERPTINRLYWLQTDRAGRIYLASDSSADPLIVLDPEGAELARWSVPQSRLGAVTPDGEVFLFEFEGDKSALVKRSREGVELWRRPATYPFTPLTVADDGSVLVNAEAGLTRVEPQAEPLDDRLLVARTGESMIDYALQSVVDAWSLPDGGVLLYADAGVFIRLTASGAVMNSWSAVPGEPWTIHNINDIEDAAYDGQDRVYALAYRGRRIYRFQLDGTPLTALTLGPEIEWPRRLLVGQSDQIYVNGGGALTSVYDSEGRWLRSIRLAVSLPQGIAVGPTGDLFVGLDGLVLHLDSTGRYLNEIVLPPGTTDPFAESLQPVTMPESIACTPDGDVLVLDERGNRLLVCSPGGTVEEVLGHTGSAPGTFWGPSRVHTSPDGVVTILDRLNQRVQQLVPRVD